MIIIIISELSEERKYLKIMREDIKLGVVALKKKMVVVIEYYEENKSEKE